MVYGYDTNEEFIDKSYQLLEKLEAKGLWNKDTLVIGLDKSVRPLAYALRKISQERGNENSDIIFLNYEEPDAEIPKNIKNRIGSKLLNYKKVLVLDDYVQSGKSLNGAKKLLKNNFSDLGKNIPLYLASLGKDPDYKNNNENYVFVDEIKLNEKATSGDTGLRDKYNRLFIKDRSLIQESIRIPERRKEVFNKFLQNRKQLSKDIKQYLHERHPEKFSGKNKSLEKIISGIFIFSFLVGLFLSSGNLTGNVIGNSGTWNNILGVVLILGGIGGFFIYKKLK